MPTCAKVFLDSATFSVEEIVAMCLLSKRIDEECTLVVVGIAVINKASIDVNYFRKSIAVNCNQSIDRSHRGS